MRFFISSFVIAALTAACSSFGSGGATSDLVDGGADAGPENDGGSESHDGSVQQDAGSEKKKPLVITFGNGIVGAMTTRGERIFVSDISTATISEIGVINGQPVTTGVTTGVGRKCVALAADDVALFCADGASTPRAIYRLGLTDTRVDSLRSLTDAETVRTMATQVASDGHAMSVAYGVGTDIGTPQFELVPLKDDGTTDIGGPMFSATAGSQPVGLAEGGDAYLYGAGNGVATYSIASGSLMKAVLASNVTTLRAVARSATTSYWAAGTNVFGLEPAGTAISRWEGTMEVATAMAADESRVFWLTDARHVFELDTLSSSAANMFAELDVPTAQLIALTPSHVVIAGTNQVVLLPRN